MRIVLDMIGAQTGSRFRGIGRYTLSLAKALIALAPNDVVLYKHPRQPTDALTIFPGPFINNPSAGRWRLISSSFEFGAGFEIPEGGEPRLATIFYDLIPLHWPETYLKRPDVNRHYHRQLAKIKNHYTLLTISEAVAKDAQDRLALPIDRIKVIGGAAESLPEGANPLKLTAKRPFVLCVSSLEPHKNVLNLLKAWAQLPGLMRARNQLLITGSAPNELFNILAMEIRRLSLSGSVRLIHHPTDAELGTLYKQCAIFISPSRYEGFGLPLLEAMSAGAACIAGNNSAQIEVAGNGAILVDVERPEEISKAIQLLLNDANAAREYRQKARAQAGFFSWTKVAQNVLEALS